MRRIYSMILNILTFIVSVLNAKETDLQTIIFMNRNTLCIRFFYMNCTISVNTTTIAAEIPKMGGGIAMKATGIVRRIDD